jgi:hypothetical protein
VHSARPCEQFGKFLALYLVPPTWLTSPARTKQKDALFLVLGESTCRTFLVPLVGNPRVAGGQGVYKYYYAYFMPCPLEAQTGLKVRISPCTSFHSWLTVSLDQSTGHSHWGGLKFSFTSVLPHVTSASYAKDILPVNPPHPSDWPTGSQSPRPPRLPPIILPYTMVERYQYAISAAR